MGGCGSGARDRDIPQIQGARGLQGDEDPALNAQGSTTRPGLGCTAEDRRTESEKKGGNRRYCRTGQQDGTAAQAALCLLEYEKRFTARQRLRGQG